MTLLGVDAATEALRRGRDPFPPPGSEPGPCAIYPTGAAAPPRTLIDILESTAVRFPRAAAIDDGQRVRSYQALLAEVRELGERLASAGVERGDRVGVRVPSGTAELYVVILALLWIGAAYVPVDVDDPDERAETVFREARTCAVISGGLRVTWRSELAHPTRVHRPRPRDDAWIIFTSGSTGTPKGVAVTHRSAAAFVDAEAGLFLRSRPLAPGDRVLAGLSVAFDASCEEMWLAWRHGACLVPAPRSLVKSGAELGDWLVQRRISVVSTVPTLAALWTPEHLRGVRLLILGGEACPEHLAAKLAAACGEVWNTYGPTEATVVASAARMTGHGPVRIGLPLDGWQLAVVDPEGRPVSWGEVGELVIAGVGRARYLDPDKDAAKFAGLPALGWMRAYRTGDLVRADREGLVYLGRMDTQVKIRGYRIELTEIESVLLRLPGIAQAVVSTYQPAPGLTELVGYYTLAPGEEVDSRQLYARLRARLPAHMVPAYLEELPDIPIMTSGKADRSKLPAPTTRCALDQGPQVRPTTEIEAVLAGALAGVLHLERVSVESHFFDDLGANSLVLAHFCGEVRRHPGLPALSMKDVYLHPTVRSLAAALTASVPRPSEPRPSRPARSEPARVGTAGYLLCGLLQALLLTGVLFGGSLTAVAGARWIWQEPDPMDLYLRSLLVTLVVLTGLCVLPVLAKWTLVGRWRKREIRLWSLDYLRFWTVQTLIRTSPLALFAGSPLYLMYLRALGAKIGPRVVILSRTVPVCTDLLTVGANTIIRKGSSFTGYRATGGVITTGSITLGAGVVVGDSSMLDIDTAIGDGGQLGHASCLHTGQAVPAGMRWHGSPAEPTSVDYRCSEAARCGTLRRAVFSIVQVLNAVIGTSVVVAAGVWGARRLSWLSYLARPGQPGLGRAGLYLAPLGLSAVLLFGGIVVGLAFVVTVPRALRLLAPPGRVYPLYGFAWWVHRLTARITGTPFFINLFGDSSYIVGYLRALGYQLDRGGQTGSNFGAALTHETPYLVAIGAETMVSDGVDFRTAEFSHTSFHPSGVSLGARSYLGNTITVPPGGRLGENCLVGTKTMIPIDGPIRRNVGLLGSPAFEIPRTTVRSDRLGLSPGEFARRMRAKNAHNVATMVIFLMVQWTRLYLAMLLGAFAVALYLRLGALTPAVFSLAAAGVDLGVAVVVERAVTGFRRLQPRYCSIYDRYFWWHERFWKLSSQPAILNGTPWKPLFWRLLGVQIGRRVFDDGASISEKTLVSIGDDTTINAGTILQAHSMEDGIFKSDRIDIAARVTLGPGVFVHYGSTIGERAHLDADSFLMKGEQIPPDTHWRGNPAGQIAG